MNIKPNFKRHWLTYIIFMVGKYVPISQCFEHSYPTQSTYSKSCWKNCFHVLPLKPVPRWGFFIDSVSRGSVEISEWEGFLANLKNSPRKSVDSWWKDRNSNENDLCLEMSKFRVRSSLRKKPRTSKLIDFRNYFVDMKI